MQCFPALLKQLFGYDGVSWLTTASKVCPDAASPGETAVNCAGNNGKHCGLQTQDDQDAKALISLLAPDGQLVRLSLLTPHQYLLHHDAATDVHSRGFEAVLLPSLMGHVISKDTCCATSTAGVLLEIESGVTCGTQMPLAEALV